MTRIRKREAGETSGMREESGGGGGQFESEHGAAVGAVAVDSQAATEFAGGERAGMQAEAVPVAPRGKSEGEDAVEVFGGDAHAVVGDDKLHAAGGERRELQLDAAVRGGRPRRRIWHYARG